MIKSGSGYCRGVSVLQCNILAKIITSIAAEQAAGKEPGDDAAGGQQNGKHCQYGNTSWRQHTANLARQGGQVGVAGRFAAFRPDMEHTTTAQKTEKLAQLPHAPDSCALVAPDISDS